MTLAQLIERIRANREAQFAGEQSSPWDGAKHPRGGYPQNRGEFSPKGGAGAVQSKSVKHPHEMTSKEFYGAYPYQHSMLRGDDPAALRGMMEGGFQQGGIGPNVARATQYPPSSLMERRYGTKAGQRVIAVPKGAVKDTPNGPKILPGHKPTEHEHAVPARDYEPLHEALVREAVAAGKPVPPAVAAEYPHLAPLPNTP